MKRALAALALLSVPACGVIDLPTADVGRDAVADCSAAGQVRSVRDELQDNYLWYRELPDPDPASFTTPEAYLEAVRYKTFDTHYSYIANKEESDALYSDSQYVGFGFGRTLVAPDDLRVTEVYPGSPAADAGLQRGARLLEINGRRVEDLLAAGALGEAIGPAKLGVTGQVRFADRGGTQRLVTMTKRVVTIPPVSATEVHAVGSRRVGYIGFHNFVGPTRTALDGAFARLRQDGADELVLDVRYNGGGLVTVATHLAGLIGGERTRGRTFVRFVHNDKNSRRDSSQVLASPANALGLSRLVLITTDNSASASELMISGLRPYMDVTVVGSRTFGKPVGQESRDFCDKTLFPVTFFTRNGRNEGDYFDGIAADCEAPDDLTRELGDPREASLAEALQFVASGRCSAAAAAQARAFALRRPPAARQPNRASGWQSLLNSY